MTETIRVRAKPGAMLADLQRQKAFVGYREVQAGEAADHVVPNGKRYALIAEGVNVPNTGYIRRAIAAGSLERLAVGLQTIEGAPVVLPQDGSALSGEPVPPVEGEPQLDPMSGDTPAATGVARRQKREV